MKIVFRVDASVKIGTGHVFRCLAMANELSRLGHKCLFVCREHQSHLGDLIINQGHGLTLLPSRSNHTSQPKNKRADQPLLWLGASWEEDARQTLRAIAAAKTDWLIVDHYALDANWERLVSHATCRIMVIDDLANRQHDCAFLLDQNLGRTPSDYNNLLPLDCRRLIGPQYALLRPEFMALREQSIKRRVSSCLNRILISFGGFDPNNLTGHVLDIISQSSPNTLSELDVVIGTNSTHVDELKNQVASLPFKTTISQNVSDMAKRMCRADLCIGAAGSSSWERACMGLPAVAVVLAENQVEVARAIEHVGAAKLISKPAEVAKLLPSMLNKMSNSRYLRKMSRFAADITDGGGVFRVLHALNIVEEKP